MFKASLEEAMFLSVGRDREGAELLVEIGKEKGNGGDLMRKRYAIAVSRRSWSWSMGLFSEVSSSSVAVCKFAR